MQASVLRSALSRLGETKLELEHALDQVKLAHSRPSSVHDSFASSTAATWQSSLLRDLAAECTSTATLCDALLAASSKTHAHRQQLKQASASTLTAPLYADDDTDNRHGQTHPSLPSLQDFVPSDEEEEQERNDRAKARRLKQRQAKAEAKLDAQAAEAADGWAKAAVGTGEGGGGGEAANDAAEKARGEAGDPAGDAADDKTKPPTAAQQSGTTPTPTPLPGRDEAGLRGRPRNLRDATIEKMQARLKSALYGTTAKKFFTRMDKDKSGSLSVLELKDLFRRVLKIPPTDLSDKEFKSFVSRETACSRGGALLTTSRVGMAHC